MVPAILDVTRVESSPVKTNKKFLFRSTGTVVKFPAYDCLHGRDRQRALRAEAKERAGGEDEAERQLPLLSEGEGLQLVSQEGQTVPGVFSKQHFTSLASV